MTAFLGKKNILFVMALVLLLSSIGSVSATAVSPSPEMDKEYQDLVEVFWVFGFYGGKGLKSLPFPIS
ncbi:hypothetical protein ACFQ49_02255 [Kroppenstedtia eburnea]|uniref:hypothetical protein n=1 Tax=Kroppenstedtia eburnea TaxID=714067 RepID=UPI00363B856A